MIDFWEKHILGDGIDKLLASVGNYGECRFCKFV